MLSQGGISLKVRLNLLTMMFQSSKLATEPCEYLPTKIGASL